MPPTEKLYYKQPPVCQFTATVLQCTPHNKDFYVVLDKTAFYPEGGGQPCDLGTLGGAAIVDVQEKDGMILHTVTQPLEPGSTVDGVIDMDRRWEMTQQHSGEHILSGTLHAMFGAENVGFHIGKEYLTMDTSIPLSAEDLANAEAYANQIVWRNLPIDETWYTKEQLTSLTYRSKKELDGPVRIVTIPQADCCACCGTHVEYTGQIGMIKIIDHQKYKAGVRLFVVCGVRALQGFDQTLAETAAIRNMLSAPSGQLAAAVEHQAKELESARFRVVQAENELFAAWAQSVQPGQPVIWQKESLSPDALRRLCAAASQKTQALCAVFSQTPQGTFAYALAQSAAGVDLRPLCKQLNQAFDGRGGGKSGFVQGSVSGDFQTIAAFLQENL